LFHAIIIPSRGRPTALSETLESLSRQTRPADDIILSLVDPSDAPPDVESYVSVRVIYGPIGSATQRNTALGQLDPRCEIVTFFDDDVEIASDYLELVQQFFARSPSVVVFEGTALASGRKLSRFGSRVPLSREEARTMIAESRERSEDVFDIRDAYGCNMNARADVAVRVRFDERMALYAWGEDSDFSVRASRFGRVVHYSAPCVVHLLAGEGRVSDAQMGFIQIVNPYYLWKKGNRETFREVCGIWGRLVARNLLGTVIRDGAVNRRARARGNLIGLAAVVRGSADPAGVAAIRETFRTHRRSDPAAPTEREMRVSASHPRARRLAQLRPPWLRVGVEAGDRAAALSVGTGLLNQALLVASGIPLARSLGPENRGYIALFLLIPLIITMVGFIGLPAAAGYYTAQMPRAARGIVHTVLGFAFMQCLLTSLVTASVLTAMFWSRPGPVRIAALVAIPSVPWTTLYWYSLYVLQGQQRFLPMNAARALPAVLSAIVAVVIWRLDLGLPVASALLTSATLLAGILTLSMARPGMRGLSKDEADTPPLRSMLKFGAKGQLVFLNPSEAFRLDQLLVGLVLSPEALGVYVVGVAFTNLPRFVADSLGWVASPRVAEQRDRAGRARVSWQYIWLCLIVTAVIVAALELAVGPVLPILFGERFRGAVPVAHVMLIGAWFLSLRRILADCLRGAGCPEAISLAEGVAVSALLISVVPLTRSLGLPGAAIAVSLCAMGSLAVLLWYASRRLRWTPQPLTHMSEQVSET